MILGGFGANSKLKTCANDARRLPSPILPRKRRSPREYGIGKSKPLIRNEFFHLMSPAVISIGMECDRHFST
jgi:hypothetical protein